MVELQNFAEELYSFELKCGDKKSVFKDFVLKDLQPKIIKYTRKQKSPTFLFLKSSEDKNLLAYAIKYQMEDFLNGNLDEMIDNLIAADRAERLKGDEEE